MIQKILLTVFANCIFLYAQDFDSVRIYINPGHGGHDSDDRYIQETGFWESEGNLTKGLKLRDILLNLNAVIQMSRTQNRTVDDKNLSVIVAEANAFDADYMHAIHSNGFKGTANYTLMLFQGFDNAPTYPDAKIMGALMGDEIYRAHRTTTKYNRGDFDFYGTGKPYLAVFRGLNMPGTLSEGSFHDYIPESWRLMNLDYRRHEAWAIARAFLNFYDAGPFPYGEIAGVVRDEQQIPDYYFIPSTNDGKLPINSIKITLDLNPGSREYNGDTKNNGFFLFDSVAPGDYKLFFEAPGYFKDSTQITVLVNNTAFADAYLTPFAPEVPTNIRVLGNGPNSLKIVWNESARASGYEVLFGTDGLTFPDSSTSENPEIILNGLDNEQVYYLRVRATNSTGISPLTKEIYAGVPSEVPHKVLIVNGFDRATNTRYDYIREYANPVNDRGYAFSYTLNETIEDGDLALAFYDIVIWILGDESIADDTFSPQEQAAVQAFLRGGGRLFVSGSEIGWDLGRTGSSSTTDIEFYENFLKAKYISDAPLNEDAKYYSAEGIADGIFGDIGEFDFDDGTHGTIDVDWPDAVSAINDAVDIVKFSGVNTTNGAAGIVFEGRFPGGRVPGRLIYLTMPFETIYPSDKRNALMSKIFDFFEGQLPLDIERKNDSEISVSSYRLLANYPNPFNPSTRIAFQISDHQNISILVYNVKGQKIRTLIGNKNYAPGKWTIEWDGQNDSGQPVASGTYIYSLQVAGYQFTRKMVLVR